MFWISFSCVPVTRDRAAALLSEMHIDLR